jgi:hypothetical protein
LNYAAPSIREFDPSDAIQKWMGGVKTARRPTFKDSRAPKRARLGIIREEVEMELQDEAKKHEAVATMDTVPVEKVQDEGDVQSDEEDEDVMFDADFMTEDQDEGLRMILMKMN